MAGIAADLAVACVATFVWAFLPPGLLKHFAFSLATAGWALSEEYCYDSAGRLLNASLLDYRMPTCLDMPMIETVLVEVPSPSHPYGVRGAGEIPIVPPPGAIANAIHHAVGVRMLALPMSPPRLLKAILALPGMTAPPALPGED